MGPLANTRDRTLKALHPYLTRQLPRNRLFELGWYDFLNLDIPEANDEVAIARQAFVYLSIIENKWNGVFGVLLAVVGYLTEKTGNKPSPQQVLNLKSLLEVSPVNLQGIEDWFDLVFR